MPDWTDKDMEQLFRKAAGQQEFEYNDAAWQDMEHLLDVRKRRRRFFFWWWRVLGLLLLVGMTGLGIYLFSDGSGNKPVASLSNQGADITARLPKDKAAARDVAEADNLQNTNRLQDAPDEPVLKEEVNGSKFRVSATKGASDPVGQTQADHAAGTPTPEFSSRAKEPGEPDLKANAVSEKVHLSGFLLPVLPMRMLDAAPPVPALNAAFSVDTAQEDGQDGFKGMYLALVAGGELTSVGPDDFAQLNAKFGLGAEYRISASLGIATGVNYLRLDYRAGEGEYTPPKGFWTRKIAPQSTTGRCDILELPLSLNYHRQLKSGAGLRVSAGLSSLLMLRQRYYYQYDLPDDDLIRKWKSNELNSYWFSLGTLSLGYDVPVSTSTSISIVPYMQFPVKGIGHGNVRLYSAGIAASFGWRL